MLVIHRSLLRLCTTPTPPAKPYTQIPFKSDQFYKLLSRRAFRVHHQQILHSYTLFQQGIIPAHHDYINQSCVRLLSFQKQLSLQEIIQVLRVCARFRVSNLAIIRHLENELYCRYEKEVLGKVIGKKRQEELEKKQMIADFEKKSRDYFGILTEEFKKETGQEGQVEPVYDTPTEEPVKPLPNTNLQDIATKIKEDSPESVKQDFNTELQALSLDDMCAISDYLVALQSEETRLLRLLGQYYKICKTATPKQLVSFFRTNSYICNKNEQQYLQNKDLYLRRSLKTLRKYQQKFHTKVIPILKSTAKQLPLQDFAQVYKQISEYTLKKRSLKRDYLKIFLQVAPVEYSQIASELYQSMKKMLDGDARLQKLLAQKQQKLLLDFKTKAQANVPSATVQPQPSTILLF